MNAPPAYQRFFAELKRRRVFRVMAVYGVVAFGVLQVADLAFPRLGMPEWTITLVLLLSLLGFPIAIVLAWAFEQTPEGLKRTVDAPEYEIAALAAAPARQRWPVGVAAAAGTALFLVGAWWMFDGPNSGGAVGALDPNVPVESIAVLPFTDLSPGGDQAYFGDGLAEELLDALARVKGLRVAARTSSFQFRGEEVRIPEVATKLNVQAVLEGSVRSGGDRVRITAQLVNAEGFHLWSKSYDRSVDEMKDLIGVQEEIAQAIVVALALAPDTTAGGALETLVAQGTDNLEAYNAVLRGRHLMAQRTPAGLAGAVEQFERAVALDPDYARAWADLAMASGLSFGWGFRRDSIVVGRARQAVDRALEIDPRLAEAYTARGYIHSWASEYDSARADQAFARAIELNPRFPTSYHWRGEVLSDNGHATSGIPYLQTALELDPLSPIIMVDLAEALDRDGRWLEADSLFASAMELEPEFRPALQGLMGHAIRNADPAAVHDFSLRLTAASEGSESRLSWAGFLIGVAWVAGDYETVVQRFRDDVPTDTSTIPPPLLDAFDAILWSLNEVEGPAAVRALVQAQAPRLAVGDSIASMVGRGYAAALAGDTAATRSVIGRLGRASDPKAEVARVVLALAIGDVEGAIAHIEALRPEEPGVIDRFFMDHVPWFDSIRDRPEFQAILAELPPYTGPDAGTRRRRGGS